MKKLLILLLVVAMFSGCAGNVSEVNQPNDPDTDQLEESDTDLVEETFKFKVEEPVTLSMFVDEFWWPYSDWSGDMPKWFTEMTNIDFDVTVAADTTELSMLVASGTLQDIVVTTQFNMLANSDLCYAWDDLIEEYNIDYAIHPAYKFVNSASDDKVYTIRVGWSADYEYEKYPTVNPEGTALVLRKDILEAVLNETGLEAITTVEELEKCFDACKELYPDVVPFTIHDSNQATRYLEAVYGAGHAGLVDIDDEAMVYIYDEKYKTVLLKMNEWVSKGYIEPENFSWNGLSIAMEKAAASQVFAMASLTSAPQNLSNNAKDAGLDHEYVALNTLFTDQSAEIAADTGWRGMFISKDCSNPEAAIKAVLFLTSKEDNGYNMLWGKEGEDWNWNEDKTEAILNWTTAESDLMEQRQFLWGWLGHDGISNNMQYGNTPANREALEWVGKIIERNPVLGKVMNQMDTESEEFIIYQNLLELNKLHANKIMLASSEEEALKLYDEMIQNADDLGGQRLNEWANTLYLDMKIEYEKVRHIGEEGWLKEEQLN